MGKWNHQWDEDLQARYPMFTLRELGAQFGVSSTTILFHADRLHLPHKPRVVGVQKHASLKARWDARRAHEFSPAVKRQRFAEEQGVCQHCHLPIGPSWQDRGPGALVTYHHIQMICDGGDGSPANCMVLHKACHGGRGTGRPLNRELHQGRKIDYSYRLVHGPKRQALKDGGRTRKNTLTWTDEALIEACRTATCVRDVMRTLGYHTVRGASTYLIREAMARLGLVLSSTRLPPLPDSVQCHVCGAQTTPSKNNRTGPWFCSKRCVGIHSRSCGQTAKALP